MTDADALLTYATRRDPEAFRHLVEQYQNLVFGTCMRRLRDRTDAEDATQETFLRLARSAGQVRSNLAAWLYAAALSSAADLIRRRGTQRKHEHAAAAAAAVTSDDPHPDWLAIREALDAALADLTDEQRSLVIERYFVGRTQADLAAERGVSQSMMSRKLTAAIEALRDKLHSRGFAVAAGAVGSGLASEASAVTPTASLTAKLSAVGVAGVGVTRSWVGTVLAGACALSGAAAVALVIWRLLPSASPHTTTPPTPAASPGATPAAIIPENLHGTWVLRTENAKGELIPEAMDAWAWQARLEVAPDEIVFRAADGSLLHRVRPIAADTPDGTLTTEVVERGSLVDERRVFPFHLDTLVREGNRLYFPSLQLPDGANAMEPVAPGEIGPRNQRIYLQRVEDLEEIRRLALDGIGRMIVELSHREDYLQSLLATEGNLREFLPDRLVQRFKPVADAYGASIPLVQDMLRGATFLEMDMRFAGPEPFREIRPNEAQDRGLAADRPIVLLDNIGVWIEKNGQRRSLKIDGLLWVNGQWKLLAGPIVWRDEER